MYAVFATGGKQYKVRKGDTLKVDLLPEACGTVRAFNEVLLVGEGNDIKVGHPLITSAAVNAEIIARDKGEKLFPFQKKRRKKHRRKIGYRHQFSRLLITGIEDGSGASETLSDSEKKDILGRIGIRLGDYLSEEENAERMEEKRKKPAKIAKEKTEMTEAKPKAKKAATTKKPAAKKVAKKKD